MGSAGKSFSFRKETRDRETKKKNRNFEGRKQTEIIDGLVYRNGKLTHRKTQKL